jgi:hypothetical protein
MSDALLREIVRKIGDAQERLHALERGEWVGPTRGAVVYNNAKQSIPNGSTTVVAFTTEQIDKGDCWSLAVSTHLIAPRDGHYLIEANVGWENGGDIDGTRLLQIFDHDGNTLASVSQRGSADAYVGQYLGSPLVHMAAADYVTIRVYQSSGAAMNLYAASTANLHQCHASLIRLH